MACECLECAIADSFADAIESDKEKGCQRLTGSGVDGRHKNPDAELIEPVECGE